MPTNFTVVPVKDSTRKTEEGDEDDSTNDSNVLRVEEEDTTGELLRRETWHFFKAKVIMLTFLKCQVLPL